MIKTNESLGVSFELPDRLTVDQLDDYQQRIGKYLNDYKSAFLSNARYKAIVYTAAVEAGLLTNWQSETMPETNLSEIGQADARVILFVGDEVEKYITSYTTISPN